MSGRSDPYDPAADARDSYALAIAEKRRELLARQRVTALQGDCREVLKTLPDQSAHCVVTSPPYWGLRDYGTARWGGGDPACEHAPIAGRGAGDTDNKHPGGAVRAASPARGADPSRCGKCGARRIDAQLGLEPTPQEHVARMVDVFREVWRVLRKDGVCWVNYGDSYAGSVNGRSAADTKATGNDDRTFRDKPFGTAVGGLKPKDLAMVPFRFALAMQDSGWWLRSVLPWVKRNGMPESIKDRPATSVEYVFMFTRSARYWYDADAVRRQMAPSSAPRLAQNIDAQAGSHRANGGAKTNGTMKAVRRDKQRGLSRRFAGFNDRWNQMERKEQVGVRNFRNSDLFFESLRGPHGLLTDADGAPLALDVCPQPFREAHFATFPPKLIEPLILAGCPKDGVVLDPFFGAGTTGLVAERLQRRCIGIELNGEYTALARERIRQDAPLFGAAAS